MTKVNQNNGNKGNSMTFIISIFQFHCKGEHKQVT